MSFYQYIILGILIGIVLVITDTNRKLVRIEDCLCDKSSLILQCEENQLIER